MPNRYSDARNEPLSTRTTPKTLMAFIDTHTHLYTEEFDADRTEVVKRAVQAGAQALLLPNIDEASIGRMMQMCADHPGLCFPMMGLHPTELPADPWPLLDHMKQMLQQPAHPFVAIGEVGIDLYWDSTRREEQIDTFRHQAEWAAEYGLPLMVHSRSAHRELVDTLRPLKDDLTGVFHCFGGSAEEAHELLATFEGFRLGIGGVVTFKKSKLPSVLHTEVPADRIVVETDSPYLAPTPHRGTRNESAHIPLIIEKLADIYAISVPAMEHQLLANTLDTFPRVRTE